MIPAFTPPLEAPRTHACNSNAQQSVQTLEVLALPSRRPYRPVRSLSWEVPK